MGQMPECNCRESLEDRVDEAIMLLELLAAILLQLQSVGAENNADAIEQYGQ